MFQCYFLENNVQISSQFFRDQPSTPTGGETTTGTANRPLPQTDEESSQTAKPTLLVTKRGKKMTKRTTQEKYDIPSTALKRNKKDKVAEVVPFISKEKLRTLKWKKGSFQTELRLLGQFLIYIYS